MPSASTEPTPPVAAPAAGSRFPDVELPDHTGRVRRLSEIAGGNPVALFTARGWSCPKEQRCMRKLVSLQGEVEVPMRTAGALWRGGYFPQSNRSGGARAPATIRAEPALCGS